MCQRISMRQYASSPRKVKTEYDKEEEELQGIAGGISRAFSLASLSAASFPWRNECPGPIVA